MYYVDGRDAYICTSIELNISRFDSEVLFDMDGSDAPSIHSLFIHPSYPYRPLPSCLPSYAVNVEHCTQLICMHVPFHIHTVVNHHDYVIASTSFSFSLSFLSLGQVKSKDPTRYIPCFSTWIKFTEQTLTPPFFCCCTPGHGTSPPKHQPSEPEPRVHHCCKFSLSIVYLITTHTY